MNSKFWAWIWCYFYRNFLICYNFFHFSMYFRVVQNLPKMLDKISLEMSSPLTWPMAKATYFKSIVQKSRGSSSVYWWFQSYESLLSTHELFTLSLKNHKKIYHKQKSESTLKMIICYFIGIYYKCLTTASNLLVVCYLCWNCYIHVTWTNLKWELFLSCWYMEPWSCSPWVRHWRISIYS